MAKQTQSKALRTKRRPMAAELISTMLDCERAADLPRDVRAGCERMMRSPRALDALVNHFMHIPQSDGPPQPPPQLRTDDFEFVMQLTGEWGRRLDERAQGGQ